MLTSDLYLTLYDLTIIRCFCKLQDPPLEPQQPSISTFLTRPVHHIREMYQVLQDIFINTTNDDSDFKGLKQVVESKLHFLFGFDPLVIYN